MKFVTEMELRDLYQRQEFTSFALEPGTKMTPGARQFLIDRRISIKTGTSGKKGNQEIIPAAAGAGGPPEWAILRLRTALEKSEATLLLAAADCLRAGSVILSEEICSLGKCIRALRQAEQSGKPPEKVSFWGWPEEEIQNRSRNLEQYFDISDFHIRLENGREIAQLNYLRADLRNLEPLFLEAYWVEDSKTCSRQELIDHLYNMIHVISIMMWKCLGGKKCSK